MQDKHRDTLQLSHQRLRLLLKISELPLHREKQRAELAVLLVWQTTHQRPLISNKVVKGLRRSQGKWRR